MRHLNQCRAARNINCICRRFNLVAAAAAVTLFLSAYSTQCHAEYVSCNDETLCKGGDVNYELIASIRTMRLLNYTYRGRTYSREGDASFSGPTMRVQPGQSLWIKLGNEMLDESIGPHEPNATDYWRMLQNPGERIKYQFYRKSVADASLMHVDQVNMPKHFDATNLHLHGLDIDVHMFHPVGTHDPDAPHIIVEPGQCYCYRFHVPAHHPTGMYWYHPHLHGSTALQIWSGMFGLLYVDGKEGESPSLMHELASQNVTDSHEFVIWDPALKYVGDYDDSAINHNLEVDEFLLGQTTLSKIHPFLVNGEYIPTFNATTFRPLHLRVLCATIENENTFIIYPKGREHEHWDDAALPFWVIASDGVTYEQPIRRNILVMAGGQREELLLWFDRPGDYVISQQGIQGMQFFDMHGHPHDQILAMITVRDVSDVAMESKLVASANTVQDIANLRLTPGYHSSETIQSHEITRTETIVFSMGTNRDQAPFPQYYINGKAFDPLRLDFFAEPGEAVEYLLVNAQHNVHPFHIHVNRFQVQEMGSELSTTKYPVLKAVLDFPKGVWRDTVIVPPNGRTRIWVQYKNYTGKTVIHCHFLAHEDTGMMATLFIGQPHTSIAQWMSTHFDLLLGIAFGVAVFAGIMGVRSFYRSPNTLVVYEQVAAMNNLKSKAVD
ncbi:hypothetical protein MPSEU_000628700 [Mayamaea pseudoterrestris]|nr:hypothetical protein MPSEU_000628700 [Mayamaea pseudoterrestris]